MKKEVQLYVLDLLVRLKQFSDEGKEPNLQVGQDGRLWLWVPVGGVFQSFIFDEEYEDIEPSKLAEAIKSELIQIGHKLQ